MVAELGRQYPGAQIYYISNDKARNVRYESVLW